MCCSGTDPSMFWYLRSFLRCAGAWRVFGGRGWDCEGVASRRGACKMFLLSEEIDWTRRQNLDVCACVRCYCPAIARTTSERSTVYRARHKQLTARFFNQGQQQ